MTTTALLFLLANQSKPVPPLRAWKPDLKLEIEQLGKREGRVVRLRFQVANRGKAGVYFAPGFLGGELMMVWFTDESGKHVRYDGDTLMGYAPLASDSNFYLGPRMFVGLEWQYRLKTIPKVLHAHAECAFKNIEHYTARELWEGQLTSNVLEIK